MYWRSPRSATPLQKSPKSAQKAQKAPAVGRTRLKVSREGHGGVVRKICVISVVCVIRVFRKIRALSALCALRSLLCDCGIWVPRPGELTRRWRVGWRPGAEIEIVRCLLVRTMRTKSPGRLVTRWMARWRDWRAIWISSVLLVDTSYRCESGQLCRVSDSYFSRPSAIAVRPRLPIPCRKMPAPKRLKSTGSARTGVSPLFHEGAQMLPQGDQSWRLSPLFHEDDQDAQIN